MNSLYIKFFKYLEDTEGQKTPLKVKLLNPKEFKLTPEDLKVEGYLNLYFSPITSLPKGLEIEGSLNLTDSKITSLPNGLKVRDNLYLSGTKITSLPDDLKVGGELRLNFVPITLLPKGLEVGRDIYLKYTPLESKTEEEIRQMAPGIKGGIFGLKK